MKNIKILMMIFMVTIFSAGVLGIDVTVNDYDPKPAEAGKSVNVWFKVDNPTNDPEEAVFIEIVPKDGLSLTSGEESKKKIGTLPSRKSEIVQFRLFVDKESFKGSHEIEARVTKDGETAPLKRDLSIEVTDKDFQDVNLGVGDIESDPSRIKPGDENVKLEVTIQNIGNGKAQGVKAELTGLPEGVTLSDSYSGTSLLGNVEADSTSIAKFYVDVDEPVKAKEYNAFIKTSYKYKPDADEDNYEYEEKMVPLKLAIKPVPIYEITKVEFSPEVLTAGDKDVKMRLTIKNVGEEKGESVRIKAYGKTEQPIDFEVSSDFIAPSLEPGEEGQGTLELRISDDANLQKYYLDLEIKNIVNEDVITYEEKVAVTVSKAKPNNPWGLVLLGIFIIAGVIIFMKFSKKNKDKPVETRKIKGKYGESYLDTMKDKR